jgi:ribose transport system permease protein
MAQYQPSTGATDSNSDKNTDSDNSARERLTRIKKRIGPYAPLIVLFLLAILISILSPRFLDPRNLIRIANSAAIPLVLSIGITFIILLGSIDLSVEGILALGSVTVSLLVLNDRNGNDLGVLGVLGVLAVGALMGFINGMVHVRLRIPSFMVTLGTGYVGVGIATVLIGGVAVRVLDTNVRALALERFLGFPLEVWVALIALAVSYVIQRYTRIGRYAYAIGGGEDLAALSGIPVTRYKVIIFTLAGVFYALGSLLASAQLGQSNALIGQGRLFAAITAVVVGGTSLSGGSGGVLNSLVGVLIVAVLENGMVLMGVSPYVQQAVQGILIAVAVAVSIDRARNRFVK